MLCRSCTWQTPFFPVDQISWNFSGWIAATTRNLCTRIEVFKKVQVALEHVTAASSFRSPQLSVVPQHPKSLSSKRLRNCQLLCNCFSHIFTSIKGSAMLKFIYDLCCAVLIPQSWTKMTNKIFEIFVFIGKTQGLVWPGPISFSPLRLLKISQSSENPTHV